MRCGVASRPLPGPTGREALRRLRAVLRRSATALMAGKVPGRRDLAAINGCLDDAPLTRRVAADGRAFAVKLVPRTGGIARVLGEVTGSFAELLATGDPTRIKICANTDCGWVVYDESRNRTRRWCESTGCRNLMKVRRYRQRHRRPSGRPVRPGRFLTPRRCYQARQDVRVGLRSSVGSTSGARGSRRRCAPGTPPPVPAPPPRSP